MKAILMSIRPQYVAKILNKEKTIEVRKRFPVDYGGWVYIYCTKDNKNCLFDFRDDENAPDKFGCGKADKWYKQHYKLLNGKVVARFWCDKVEKIHSYLEPEQWYMTSDLGGSGLLQKSCLTFEELDDYLLSGYGYAIHITKLEIFNEPKEISEFKTINPLRYPANLYRAPQSFCFIEV